MACTKEIVICADWHDVAVARLDLVGHNVGDNSPLALFDAKELVRLGMNLAVKLFPRSNQHNNQLQL